MNRQQQIHVDPAICKGRVRITGTRITVSSVLDQLADGMAPDTIVAGYSPLTADAPPMMGAEYLAAQVLSVPRLHRSKRIGADRV